MPVQEIVRALGGQFVATALYSIEFREEGRRGPQVFFLNPPESYTVTESARSVYTPTARGGVVTDHGNEAKDIVVEGSLNYFYAGTIGGGAADRNRGDIREEDILDGYSGIQVIKFIGMRFRDYTLSASGRNPAYPFWSRKPALPAEACQQIVNNLLSRGKGALHDRFTPVWHAHDEDDHFLVRQARMSVRKAIDDKWTAKYTLEMQAYRVDDLAIRRGDLGSVRAVKIPAVERLARAQALMHEIEPISVPTTITVSTAAGAVQVPGRTLVQPSPVLI